MTSRGISLAVLGKDCICRVQLVEAALADLPITPPGRKAVQMCQERASAPLLAAFHSPISL